MLKQLTLRNFKGWRALETLEFSDITVLFGTNSSGKTSVLQSILMLKQTAESYDRKRALHFGGSPTKDYVDLGSFDDLIYGHDSGRPLEISLNWHAVENPDFAGGPTGDPDLHYEGKWGLVEGEVVLSHLQYASGTRSFGLTRQSDGRYDAQVKGFNRRVGRPWPLAARPESCYALPLQARREVQRADPLEFNHQFELLIKRIGYLGPLREYPKRLYTWTGETPQTIDPRGSNALDVLLATARANHEPRRGKYRQPELIAQVESWLRRLELATNFTLPPMGKSSRVYEAKLRPRNAPSDASLIDVGFGVSQVLPIVVLLLSVPPHSIVILEQPEIHLHPSVQANLADLFLEVAETRSLQLIIESHSEHLLRRMQRRIAENKQPLANPAHLRLYFCGVEADGCNIQSVQTDAFGKITNWPNDFFGNVVADLDEMTMAALERKKEELGLAGGRG